MVNSSADNQLISDNPEIVLPESTSQLAPEDAPTLIVTRESVLLNGHVVMSRVALDASEGAVAAPLTEALVALAVTEGSEVPVATPSEPATEPGRPVNILADQELPYAVLRKLMASCTEAGYSAISLAVTQKHPEGA